jgi:ABC-type glycerol-3-phosphate transport system substrate-binding protein
MSTDFNRRTFLAQASAIGMGGILPAQAAHAAASGELSVWKFGGTPNEVEQWPLKNKEFLAANPKVSLKYSFFNGQIRRQKIIAGLQTNRLPDVIIAFGQDIPEFAGFGMLRPLDAIAADRIKGWRARIVPEVMATGMHEGKLYGVPTYVDMASFLAVDMDALSEAGFKRPPASRESPTPTAEGSSTSPRRRSRSTIPVSSRPCNFMSI